MITNFNTTCPMCKGDAILYTEEGRHFIECISGCGYKDYLKNYARPRNNKKLDTKSVSFKKDKNR